MGGAGSSRPDRRHSFADWLRMLLEDMLVIDAATIYPRYQRAAARSIALDIIDGATIKPLIGEDGRAPEPPDPAYQQILHGVPAADFSADELLYLPRNVRAHRLYGMSPVEQIALTVNIALRRDVGDARLLPRRAPSPDAFATLPKEWTADQIRAVPGLFRRADERQSRRDGGMTKFMPADFKPDRDPPAAAEGPVRRVAGAHHLLRLLGARLGLRQPGQPRDQRDAAPAGDAGGAGAAESVGQERARPGDPGLHRTSLRSSSCGSATTRSIRLQQAQTLQILVGAGMEPREEARAELGLGGAPPGAGARAGLGK